MKFLGLVVGSLIAATTAAHAATLDFDVEGAKLERVVEGQTLNFGGIGVTFNSGPGQLAVLDDRFQGRLSGLGVCTGFNPASNSCNPNGEDNITVGDFVMLMFSRAVNLSKLVFRGERHFEVDDASGEITSAETLVINGMGLTFGEAMGSSFKNVKSISFAYGGANPEQYYVGSMVAAPVPVPASIGLLAAGLGLLSAAGWRRRST